MGEQWTVKGPDEDGAWEVGFTSKRGAAVLLGYGLTEDAARLIAAAPDYAAAVEQMLAHEDAGGDGWWKGWEMLKAAHAKTATTSAHRD